MVEHALRVARVVMLLSNPYNPDDRVRNEALALRDAGHEVTILAWDRDCTRPEQEKVEGLEVRRARIRAGYQQGAKQGLRFLRLWQWFADEMRQLQPHVVHCHDFDTFPAGVWHWSKDRRVHLVLDAHENYYIQMKPFVSTPVACAIKMVERLLTQRAHLVIAACEATAEYYRALGARKTVVVGNWKDPASYQFAPKELLSQREELGIGDRLVVAYIGNLSRWRAVLPLIQVVRERTQFFLILGGRGDQEEALRAACSGADNVYFPGYIHPREVPLLTALSDIIFYGFDPAHPSAPYNAPNKLYEALAAGKAVLATDIGGELSRVVREEQCGLLIPEPTPVAISHALDRLQDRCFLAELQRQARRASERQYNWAKARNRLIEAYAL